MSMTYEHLTITHMHGAIKLPQIPRKEKKVSDDSILSQAEWKSIPAQIFITPTLFSPCTPITY